MPRIKYEDHKFGPAALSLIATAEAICLEYAAQGFDLTLRQLYYQFVARGIIANKQTEYKRLGGIVNDARMAGLLDWSYIVDRTRELRELPHWSSPAEIIEVCANQYRRDLWADQPCRVEVWIEKDALAGVFQAVCQANDVPYFSCRGYTSQSEMWAAARRLEDYLQEEKQPVILHFGDHDPSGIDMTRDIGGRLATFMGGVDVRRLALNMDQVDQYNPPPNPAKTTDSRYASYIELYSDESWELDALSPTVLAALVQEAIDSIRDQDCWDYALTEQSGQKALLKAASDRWDDLEEQLAEAAS